MKSIAPTTAIIMSPICILAAKLVSDQGHLTFSEAMLAIVIALLWCLMAQNWRPSNGRH